MRSRPLRGVQNAFGAFKVQGSKRLRQGAARVQSRGAAFKVQGIPRLCQIFAIPQLPEVRSRRSEVVGH